MRRRSAEPVELAVDQNPYLEELAAELEVDLKRLEEELAGQPTLAWRVGREEARLTALLAARKRELEAIRAQVDGQVRRAAGERGKQAVDAEVAAQIVVHADVARAQRAVDEASERVRAAAALVAAFEQRLVVLGHLAGRQRGMSRS